MHTDTTEVAKPLKTKPHRNRHLAERFEGLLSQAMVAAVVILAIGMVWMLMTTDSTPSWMR